MQQIRNVPCTSFIFLNYCIILNKHKILVVIVPSQNQRLFTTFLEKFRTKKSKITFLQLYQDYSSMYPFHVLE